MRRQLLIHVIANIGGRGWSAVLAVAVVPFYLSILGVEVYGLIGFYASLQAVFYLLDAGMSTTLNRELARLSGLDDADAQARMGHTTRTLEAIYWAAAVAMALVIVGGSPLIARHWLSSDEIPVETLSTAVALMGITLAARFPYVLYTGGLMGLERQVTANIVTVVGATLRYPGTLVVLMWIRADIETFFLYQVAVGAVETLLAHILMWRYVPGSWLRSRFDRRIARDLIGFTGGLTGINIAAAILMQADKVVLSKLITLEEFGYYMLAYTVVFNVQSLIVFPVFNAVFPRFSRLHAADDSVALTDLYHRACQMIAVFIVPVAAVLVLYATGILTLWTRDPATAAATAPLLAVLVLGTALNSFTNLPYAMQLAAGWVSLAMKANIYAIVIAVPTIIVAASYGGAFATAWVWVGLNVTYLAVVLPLMHRRLLVGELRRFYLHDMLIPAAVAVLAAVAATALLRQFPIPLLLQTMVVWLLSCLCTLAIVPGLRGTVLGALQRLRHRST